MMPVKKRGRVFTAPESIVDQDRLTDLAGEAMRTTVDSGRDRMKALIGVRGTYNRWQTGWGSMPHGTPGREGSYPGRVASGKMQDAVDSDVQVSGKSVTGSFGWIAESEPYFLMQEEKFKHAISGRTIEGMHALRDAGEQTDKVFSEEMDNAIRKFLAGK